MGPDGLIVDAAGAGLPVLLIGADDLGKGRGVGIEALVVDGGGGVLGEALIAFLKEVVDVRVEPFEEMRVGVFRDVLDNEVGKEGSECFGAATGPPFPLEKLPAELVLEADAGEVASIGLEAFHEAGGLVGRYETTADGFLRSFAVVTPDLSEAALIVVLILLGLSLLEEGPKAAVEGGETLGEVMEGRRRGVGGADIGGDRRGHSLNGRRGGDLTDLGSGHVSQTSRLGLMILSMRSESSLPVASWSMRWRRWMRLAT